ARADDANDLHRDTRTRARAARRDLPCAWSARLDADRQTGVGIPRGSARRAHRRVAARTRNSAIVAPGKLRDRAERSADPRVCECGRTRSPRALRRSTGTTQGLARLVARVA